MVVNTEIIVKPKLINIFSQWSKLSSHWTFTMVNNFQLLARALATWQQYEGLSWKKKLKWNVVSHELWKDAQPQCDDFSKLLAFGI